MIIIKKFSSKLYWNFFNNFFIFSNLLKRTKKNKKKKNSIKLLYVVKWGVVNECVGMRSGLHKPLSLNTQFLWLRIYAAVIFVERNLAFN